MNGECQRTLDGQKRWQVSHPDVSAVPGRGYGAELRRASYTLM